QSIALSQPESDSAEILELQTEPFPALGAPIEWTFGMWIDAARFVLELWSALLSRGVTIAMPTPEAVSFRHVSALFVHPCAIGSVTSEGFRLGARRFVRHFLVPIHMLATGWCDTLRALLRKFGAGPSP